MRPQEKSVSSNDAGDNLPLRYAYSNESPTKNSLEDLLRHNIQTCEFCEARCENKFDMLIHNSTHIIIPLIKEATHRCRECDMLCISDEHLSHHMSMRHAISPPKNVMNGVKLSEKIMFDNEEFEMNDQFENETLDRLIREEQQDNGLILQNLVMNCKVDVQKFDTPWLDNQKVIPNGVSTVKRKSVKNEPSSDLSILDDPIVLVTPMALTKNENEHKSEYGSDNKSYFESIHYYELMKPGIYYCKHCHKRFPNRYDVIIHEIVHMDLSKVISVKRKEQRPNSPDGRVSSQQVKYSKDISVKRKEQRPNSPDARVKSPQQVKYPKDISVKKKERRHSIHDSLMSLNRKERRHSNQDILMKSPRKVKNAIHVTTCQYCQAQVIDPTEHEKNCLKFICFCGKRYARKFWLEKHQTKEGHDLNTRPDSTPDLKLDPKPARIADRIHFEEHEQFSIKKHDQEEKNKKDYEEEERNKKKKPLTKMDRLKMIQTRIKLINKQGYAAQYAQASHKKKFLRIEKQQDR